MEQRGDITLYTFEDVLDERFGKIGTPERDKFENEVSEAVQAYKLGEAVKRARLAQKLTQSELGERVGVKKAQISRIEKGNVRNIFTIGRVFNALGVPYGNLDLGGKGTVALW